MTLNEYYAFAVIREANLETPADVETFVGAVQILFPDYDRDSILNMPIERMVSEVKSKAEALAEETKELKLRIQGEDAVERAKKILGSAVDGD